MGMKIDPSCRLIRAPWYTRLGPFYESVYVPIEGGFLAAYVIYGDNFLVAVALEELRSRVSPSELLEANSHVFSLPEYPMLKATCDAVPFLAAHRLVTVEGLLGQFESRDGRRGGSPSGRRSQGRRQDIGRWKELPRYIAEEMPDTTLLVFREERLSRNNPLLKQLQSCVQVQALPAPTGEALARWIRTRIERREAQITPGAILVLTQTAGNDMWALDNDLEKLSLYAGGRPIEEADVTLLVTQSREASIFAAADALLEGRNRVAMRLMRRLREDGAELPYIVAMISRQLRAVTLARNLMDRKVGEREIGERLGIPQEFIRRKAVAQAKRHSWNDLKWLYSRLLEVDLAVKRGRANEDVALELLVSEASALSRGRDRPATRSS